MLNLIGYKLDIDETYLYAKILYEPKCYFLINKSEEVGIDSYDDTIAFQISRVMSIKVLGSKTQVKSERY